MTICRVQGLFIFNYYYLPQFFIKFRCVV